jgi:hypothetical protein
MDFLDDPKDMAPDTRLAEVAAILAAGYRRSRGCSEVLATASTPPVLTEKELDSSGAPRPLCVEGLTGGDPAPTEVST